MGQLSIISGHSCVTRLQVTSLSRLLMTFLWCEQITSLYIYQGHYCGVTRLCDKDTSV